jgi:hypothetical protein
VDNRTVIVFSIYNYTTTEGLIICQFYKNGHSISVVISKSYEK